MHYEVLLPVVAELSSLLAGARVERVLEGEDRGLYLLVRNDRKNFTLLLSPGRSLPRLHLVSAKPQSSADPHPLVLNLRSRIVGARITSIALLNQDRVAELRFARDGDEYRLIFELTGSSTNLFFIDADSRILALYYPVSISEKASRTLLAGAQYVLPEKRTASPSSKTAHLVDEDPSPNKAAEAHYERLAEKQQTEAIRSALRVPVGKALARAERLREALSADLDAVQDPEPYRIKGDLILANLRQLKTGMECADLTAYDGTRANVRLDPKRSPARNAELYFKKYKKAKTGRPVILSRLREVEKQVSGLRSLLGEINEAADRDSLLAVQSGFSDRGYKKGGAGSKRQATAESLPGIRTIAFHGWEILVGRSASGNDLLTTKLARPDDLWLHAEGLPGSHVLVRNPKKTEVPADILIKAAALAALYSKGKAAAKVPVTYTPARFVRKPRGAKPGLVTLSQRKTMMVRPDDGSPV